MEKKETISIMSAQMIFLSTLLIMEKALQIILKFLAEL